MSSDNEAKDQGKRANDAGEAPRPSSETALALAKDQGQRTKDAPQAPVPGSVTSLATLEPPPSERRLRVSERQLAANRANAQKSTGPRTEAGKLRASQNARRSVRLLGLAEARTLNQDPGAAARLYQDLIAPYLKPLHPLLAMHLHDLARTHLELEAAERIRDAVLEHRWQQADLEKRRLYHAMEGELWATAQEILQEGLVSHPDSPAKFKMQADRLRALKNQIEKRDFNIEALLHSLYGRQLNPKSARAQTICIRCSRLMKGESLSQYEFEDLLWMIEEEEAWARRAHVLELDDRTMSRAACMAKLGPLCREDNWLIRQCEGLRQAIDRKQGVITRLLQSPGLAQADGPNQSSRHSSSASESSEISQNEPNEPLESIRSDKNEAKTKPKAKVRPRRATRKSRRISGRPKARAT